MAIKITNKPCDLANFKLNFYQFNAAREALAEIINILGADKKILIPAFIGYSVREGSGIFDPIRKSGINYEFYKMDDQLNIDVPLLSEKIKKNPGSIVLLVHYWGFVDPACAEIKHVAVQNECAIVEDFAHGLFTFFKNPIVDFDYGFFSLHKMFPYEDGGVLISKKSLHHLNAYNSGFFEYNLLAIAKVRVENYLYLLDQLKRIASSKVTLLRKFLGDSVPQTFPILLNDNSMKDFLYFKMNEAGFGVVSLYHQLISEVDESFSSERDISSRILNLPIHQDVTFEAIDAMVNFLRSACEEYESKCIA